MSAYPAGSHRVKLYIERPGAPVEVFEVRVIHLNDMTGKALIADAMRMLQAEHTLPAGYTWRGAIG